MMNKVSHFFLLALMFCLSCSDEPTKKGIEFPEVVTVKGEPLTNIEVFSSGNVNLIVIDTFLVIQKAQEKFVGIYSTNSYKRLAEIGMDGRGPTEFKRPELLKQTSYDDKNNSPIIYIHDFRRKKVSTINIFDAIETDKTKLAITELEMPNIKEFLTYFFYQNDSFLLATPETGQRFLKFDLLTGQRINIPFIPKKEYEFSSEVSSIMYRSTVVVNEEQNLFAAAPLSFGQLDFFDLEGNYLRSTTFDADNDLKLKDDMKYEDLAKFKHHIVHLQKNDKYIYALNYNNLPKEIRTDSLSNNMEIQVYDWDGNAIKKYELNDKRSISSFAIDKKHNRIYGYTKFEQDHNIIVYDLN